MRFNNSNSVSTSDFYQEYFHATLLEKKRKLLLLLQFPSLSSQRKDDVFFFMKHEIHEKVVGIGNKQWIKWEFFSCFKLWKKWAEKNKLHGTKIWGERCDGWQQQKKYNMENVILGWMGGWRKRGGMVHFCIIMMLCCSFEKLKRESCGSFWCLLEI